MTSWRVARNEPRKIITEHGLMIGRAVLHKSGPSVKWTEAEAESHANLMSLAPEMLTALMAAEIFVASAQPSDERAKVRALIQDVLNKMEAP